MSVPPTPPLAGPKDLKACPFCGGEAKEIMQLFGCEPCALVRRTPASWNTRAEPARDASATTSSEFDPAPLVEAAKKATQGKWHTDRYKAYVWGENDEMIADRGGGDGAIRARGHGARLPVADNLDHIAAANPSAILAWAARDAEQVAEIERLRAALDDLTESLLDVGGWQDIEGGQDGEGPLVRALRVLGKPITEDFADWLGETACNDPDGGPDEQR